MGGEASDDGKTATCQSKMVSPRKFIAHMRITRLRASPRHGGAGGFFEQVLIRRGGVPSGAAAFITDRIYTHRLLVQVRYKRIGL